MAGNQDIVPLYLLQEGCWRPASAHRHACSIDIRAVLFKNAALVDLRIPVVTVATVNAVIEQQLC